MTRLFVPSVRGYFGDWVYYSCVLPVAELANRAHFARELHKSQKLSDLIQRELKEGRSRQIADYLLKKKQRFFNSLVIAVYDGEPVWLELGKVIPPKNAGIDGDIPPDLSRSLGFLSFTGDEKLFAIDGQHRLAGMKEAITRADFSDDEVPVIFVAHKNSPSGLIRSRSLFTTLNKTAKPVSKGEIIALDENDTMAICVRRLVEEHQYFTDDRIAFNPTNNLPTGDFESLTTIGALYDVLKILFRTVYGKLGIVDLEYNRPSDPTLERHYNYCCDFFAKLRDAFPPLKRFFEAKKTTTVVRKYRGEHGGNILFRPAGLLLITEVIARLSKRYSLQESINIVRKLPLDLDERPYEHVLWNPRTKTMIAGGRALARKLICYMLGENSKPTQLGEKYAARLDRTGEGSLLLKELRTLVAARPLA